MNNFFSSDLFKTLAGGVLTLGTSLIINNQNVQNAKGQANATQQALDKEYAIAQQNAINIKLMQQAGKDSPEKEEKSNLPLYIGLGVGGVVIFGVVIFAVTRK
jgi:hypothetical protein